jgi:ADP-ribosylglycohydrolase
MRTAKPSRSATRRVSAMQDLSPHIPLDHGLRLERAYLALDGLSVGDALGPYFGIQQLFPEQHPSGRQLLAAMRRYTDDTDQAIGVAQVLHRHGRIDQDELASLLGRRYVRSLSVCDRQYGASVQKMLRAIYQGGKWQDLSRASFAGQGSMGNGAAMRVAPVGAYFADDLDRVAREARLSAEVTHAHPEGQAGAIATAIAAARAWQLRGTAGDTKGRSFLEFVAKHTPHGATYDGLVHAAELPLETAVQAAVQVLGNGSQVTAPDTVPFALWCAARHLDDYAEAIWATAGGCGDVDTNCAIVGGIIILATGREQIPKTWLAVREPLDFTEPDAAPDRGGG